MAEEIKIVVREVREGTALKDAQADADKLRDSVPRRGVQPVADAIRAKEEAEKEQAKAAVAKLNQTPAAVSPERLSALMRAQGYEQGKDGQWAKSTAGDAGLKSHFDAADKQDEEEASQRKAKRARKEKAQSIQDQRGAIAGLESEAKEYRAKGDSGAGAALAKEAAIRKESLRLQMQTGASEAAATAQATARLAAEEKIAAAKAAEAAETKLILEEEKAIAKQKALQAAEAKLAIRTGLQGGASAMGGSLGSLSGMIGAAPALMPIIAAMAVLGKVMGTFVAQASDLAQSRQEGFQAAGRVRTIRGHSGVRGEHEASQNADQINAALEEAEGKKGTFQNVDPVQDWAKRFLKFATFGKANVELSGEKGERENQNKINRLKKDKEKADADAMKRATEGVGGMEMAKTEAELHGQLGVARGIQIKIDRQKAYAAALAEVGNDESKADQRAYANKKADLKVMEDLRNESMKFGSLVNARSGQSDIARAASLAQKFQKDGGLGDPAKLLAAMHDTMKSQHAQIMNATRMKFGRGS